MTGDLVASNASAFFGPSEPNWAKQVRARRLAGILNLTCLLSPVTFISDNDVADNENFFEAFTMRGNVGVDLYTRLKRFAEFGFVKLLLRDESYRLHSQIPIGSFSDVYGAWQAQDPTNAWMLQDFGSDRERYFQDLDSWARGEILVRYPYRRVKELFMANVRREAYADGPSAFKESISSLPPEMTSAYYDLVQREWFSLTDINTLLQDWEVPDNHSALLNHGMMNQLTFSGFRGTALVGTDAFESTTLSAMEPAKSRRKLQSEGIEELLERADEVLDGPSLAILSILSPEEIAHLRSFGKSYFALLSLSQDPMYWEKEQKVFGPRFVRAATNYWAQICDYLQVQYSGLVEEPTPLGIFLGFDPSSDSLAQRAISIAVETGIDASTQALSLPEPTKKAAKGVMSLVRLRFLFLTPTDEFDRIRKVLPSSSWFRRSRPDMLR